MTNFSLWNKQMEESSATSSTQLFESPEPKSEPSNQIGGDSTETHYLNEELFNWNNVGLNSKFQQQKKEAKKDKKIAQSQNISFRSISL